MAGGEARIPLVTYNVLSSSLCEPSFYTNSDPEALDPDARLVRVLAKLEGEVRSKSIICLQEISRSWSGELHTFFAQRGYHFVHSAYGGQRNGFMGVSVAFPISEYDITNTSMDRVSNFKAWPRAPKPGALSRFGSAIVGVYRKIRGRRPPIDPWNDAMKRHNCLVYVRLVHKVSGKPFHLATYHMPCQFRVPSVMTIHAALVQQRLHELAGEEPLIWCGDFNVMPGDGPYKLITEGSLDPEHEAFPPPRSHDSWEPTVPMSLVSAYKQKLGDEPAFTNWAQTRKSPPFIGTLDYVFMSEGCRAVELSPVPTTMPREDGVARGGQLKGAVKGMYGGPFPTTEEPSDHLMVGATVELP